MRVLVTGGCGFIGSHLVDRLVNDGHEVHVVDNLSSGHARNLNPRAHMHDADVRSAKLAQAFREARPEAVFHMAAQISVAYSTRAPVADASANIMGTLNLIKQCGRHGVRHVIYSSTGGALYGEPIYLPCDEEHPVKPLSPYGASKFAAETYLHTMSSLGGFGYTCLRYSNVYGPRQDPHGEAGVVAIFCGRMLRDEEVVIFGDGSQERDFVYVDDVVEANVKALEQEAGGVYNIGAGVGTDVNTVFQALADAAEYTRQPRYAPYRKGDVYKIRLDAGLAERELGWEPKVGIDEGLQRTLGYFRSAMSAS